MIINTSRSGCLQKGKSLASISASMTRSRACSCYAMTSYSSQGQTADRVLIHVDTELSAKELLSSRMAYVSVSRGRYDAQIYTNNAQTLGQVLSRDVSHSPAIQQEPGAQKIEQQPTHTNGIGQGFGLGL
jgi:hypothetical protein